MTIEERNTAKAIQDIAKELRSIRKEGDKIKIIDWEQRRYEIARDVLCVLIHNDESGTAYISPDDREMQIKYAIAYADALIEELKKERV